MLNQLHVIGCTRKIQVFNYDSLDRYKGSCIMLGNHYEYGLNYDETFALFATMTTVRTISEVVPNGLKQMDTEK